MDQPVEKVYHTTEHEVPTTHKLLAAATDTQRAAFKDDLQFHVGLAILTCTESAGAGSSIAHILLTMNHMFPSSNYQIRSLVSLLYAVPCPWIDQVAQELLDYDSYFEVCSKTAPKVSPATTGYASRLPSDNFRVRPGQEYRFMCLPADAPRTSFQFKKLPIEIRESVLGHLLVCPNAVLSIDVMENVCRQGLRRLLPPKIEVATVGSKATIGSRMQINLPKKLAILRTDKDTFAEGRRVFFQRNKFRFDACSVVEDLKGFVRRFGVKRTADMSSLTISIERRTVLVKLLRILRSSCPGLRHLLVMLDGCGMFIEVDQCRLRRYGGDRSSFREVGRAQSTSVWDNATLSMIGQLVN